MALKHQAEHAGKWRMALRQAKAHLPGALPPLLCLTDPERMPDPVGVAQALPQGTGVIYRHFGASERLDIAAILAGVSRARGLTLLIAADPLLALEVGADGVHWPERKLPRARNWRGRFGFQTASAHSRRAIWRAGQAGMDAVLVSTVFASNSPSAGRPIGPARLARLALTSAIPVYGLGGVNADNARQISEFAGLAAVEALAGPT
ncbi:MAG: thiamine phosphate synthase [Pseudomonadota bacterium]